MSYRAASHALNTTQPPLLSSLQVDPPSWRRAASQFRRSIKSRQQPEAADAGASKGASHAADLDPITGLYQIKPLVDGRIRNVQQEVLGVVASER